MGRICRGHPVNMANAYTIYACLIHFAIRLLLYDDFFGSILFDGCYII